ncbi:hypothetical protein U9M48_041106 [Paspalum notatum var. saurae]|uniref:Uncharacterized protein n=1 Tax=Paspalum notatum var. saurae TaxID=547442 RepID=A0AAQ3UN26_PASNO
MSLLRRFLYLVGDDFAESSYSLRRIDMSRFFFPPSSSSEGVPTPLDRTGGAGATCPQSTLDARSGLVDFVLFKNKGHDGENLRVVAIDLDGGTLVCDPSAPPVVEPLTFPAAPKLMPFSLTVGDRLYVLDAFSDEPDSSFEALYRSHVRSRFYTEWCWQPLPAPPYVHGRRNDDTSSSRYVKSCAVVAGTDILVSSRGGRTYRFDTVESAWTVAGDWPLPFSGLAEYVPEHRLWFGLSSSGQPRAPAIGVGGDDDGSACGPRLLEGPPPAWRLVRSYAVHLGYSKFCIARFFEIGKRHLQVVCPDDTRMAFETEDLQLVLTGVEVESCGQELRVVKHKSGRYKLTVDGEYSNF